MRRCQMAILRACVLSHLTRARSKLSTCHFLQIKLCRHCVTFNFFVAFKSSIEIERYHTLCISAAMITSGFFLLIFLHAVNSANTAEAECHIEETNSTAESFLVRNRRSVGLFLFICLNHKLNFRIGLQGPIQTLLYM